MLLISTNSVSHTYISLFAIDVIPFFFFLTLYISHLSIKKTLLLRVYGIFIFTVFPKIVHIKRHISEGDTAVWVKELPKPS